MIGGKQPTNPPSSRRPKSTNAKRHHSTARPPVSTARLRSWGAAPGYRSEGQELVGGGAELGRIGRGHPASVDLREVLFGRPTGDGASLSDKDRNGMIPQLGNQLAHRRHADALHLLEVVTEQQLGRIAGKEHRG